MNRQSRLIISILILTSTSTISAFAGGAWLRERGSGYAKLGFTTLGANMYHNFDGSLTDSLGQISTQTMQLYGEFGIGDGVVAIVDIPIWKRNNVEGYESVTGIGDPLLGFKMRLLDGDYPVAGGALLAIPLGDPEGLAVSNDVESFETRNLPTGDGEMNLWIFGAVSHSFWPSPFYASFEAGYNIRSIALHDFTARPQFESGKLTNTYFVQLEAGYQPFEEMWIIGRLRRYAPAGTPVEGRYSFFGLGEGVEYNAYFIGGTYALGSGFGLSVDVAGAFGVRAIFGGVNIMGGLTYEW